MTDDDIEAQALFLMSSEKQVWTEEELAKSMGVHIVHVAAALSRMSRSNRVQDITSSRQVIRRWSLRASSENYGR